MPFPRRALRAGLVLAALACNGGLEPERASGICPAGFTGACGTVRFHGTIPDSTQLVYVVAYARFPQSTDDLLLFQPIPPPVLDLPSGPGDTISTYQLPLPAGRYEWLLAVWKKIGTLDLTNADQLLREAGFYRNPANPSLAGVIDVVAGAGRDSIDFVVDFGNMHPVSFYFPPAVR
jgi:hypothetical protein